MTILAVISLGKQNKTVINDARAYSISQLAKTNTEHQYILCLPQQFEGFYEETFNLRMMYYRESVFSFINKLRLQKIIQETKPDLCICADEAVPVTSKTPVYRWVSTQLSNKHNRFLKQTNTKWLLHENPGTFWQNKFTQYQITYIVNSALLPTKLLPESDKHFFKQQYTSGHDFILYNFIDIDNPERWILLIKAFTQCKQWNKTGLNLLIACKVSQKERLLQLLQSYKLREEVHLLTVENALVWENAIHAAYMLVDMPDEVKQTASILCALQYGVALIVPDHSFFISVLQDTVLFAKTDIASIASKMTLVYKDENGCAERREKYGHLINSGNTLVHHWRLK